MADSKFCENGIQNSEIGLVGRTALRDLQNGNRVTVSKPKRSFPSKEIGPIIDANVVSVSKRPPPEGSVSPAHHRSPSSTGHLAYVRRKAEAKAFKRSPIDNRCNKSDNTYLNQLGHQEQAAQPKLSSFLMSDSPGKPSIPFHLGKSAVKSPSVESNYAPFSNNITSPVPIERRNPLHWEERSLELQKLLSKLDQSNQEDYPQELRSLSSTDLSRHAVNLEMRTIQLALEEGKEMERVIFLNVLGGKSP